MESIKRCETCENMGKTREKNKKDIVDYKLSKDTFIIEKNAEQ